MNIWNCLNRKPHKRPSTEGASYIEHSIRIMEWESVWIEWINFNVKFKADLSSKNKALLAVTPIWYLKTAYPSKSEFSWNM